MFLYGHSFEIQTVHGFIRIGPQPSNGCWRIEGTYVHQNVQPKDIWRHIPVAYEEAFVDWLKTVGSDAPEVLFELLKETMKDELSRARVEKLVAIQQLRKLCNSTLSYYAENYVEEDEQ